MDRYYNTPSPKICSVCNTEVPYFVSYAEKCCSNCYVKPSETNWEKYDRYIALGISDKEARSDCFR